MSAYLPHGRVDLGVENLLVNFTSGLSLSKALREEKHPGAPIGDENIVRDVVILKVDAGVSDSFREIFHAVADLEDEAPDRELGKLVHFDTTFLSAVGDSHSRCSFNRKGSCQIVGLQVQNPCKVISCVDSNSEYTIRKMAILLRISSELTVI